MVYIFKSIADMPVEYKKHVIEKLVRGCDFVYYHSFMYVNLEKKVTEYYVDDERIIGEIKKLMQNKSPYTRMIKMIQIIDYTAKIKNGIIVCISNRYGYPENYKNFDLW